MTSIETLSIHGGRTPDPTTGAIVPPICQSTTYAQRGLDTDVAHTYSRASNPTVSVLEDALGALEDAPPAVCFGTGMAAITTLLLSESSAGDHGILSDVIYGGSVRLVREVLARFGVETTFVDTSDPVAVERAVRPTTRWIFIETPANPTLKLTDVEVIARTASRAGVPLFVDNTFLTPVILRPLDLGATVSVYSTTKYIDGHNATVGGALVTRDEALLERLQRVRKTVGSIQSPQNAWLTLQGLKTLPIRLKTQCENAAVVARWLESHPEVERVAYPGLESFPQYSLAAKQHASRARGSADTLQGTLHGALIAFTLCGGLPAVRAALGGCEWITLAENLGSVESLATHPVTMTHGDVPREQRESAGITDGLVRLSIGLENPADLIADLERALERASAVREGGRRESLAIS